MEQVAGVDIDATGRFKYILIQVTDRTDAARQKLIVRGYGDCGFHGDILDKVEPALTKQFKLECLGGGRILHTPDEKKLVVFGYSTGFGKADHAKSVEILKRRYPDYNITCTDEGY